MTEDIKTVSIGNALRCSILVNKLELTIIYFSYSDVHSDSQNVLCNHCLCTQVPVCTFKLLDECFCTYAAPIKDTMFKYTIKMTG